MCGVTSLVCCIFILVQVILTVAMLNRPEGEEFSYFNEELGKECKAVKWEEETEYCIYDYCTEEETCTEMRDWENSEAYRKFGGGKSGGSGKSSNNSNSNSTTTSNSTSTTNNN